LALAAVAARVAAAWAAAPLAPWSDLGGTVLAISPVTDQRALLPVLELPAMTSSSPALRVARMARISVRSGSLNRSVAASILFNDAV
jgi:hypothetical protein